MLQKIKSFTILILLVCVMAPAVAQEKKGKPFNPQRFRAELEQFITIEAGLSPQEAAAFFPLHNQMMEKQRVIFDEMRRLRYVAPGDDQAAKKAIARIDELEIEAKQLQQNYHQRFMQVLAPSKVLKAIQAEEKFHKRAFQRVVKRGHNPAPPKK